MKIAFVILNYGTYKETAECISSIIKHIDIDDFNITIVDNCSLDDSLLKLRNQYSSYPNIDIVTTGENLGFAKGNNIGIKHVNEKYEPDFVIVLNSDTELFQDDLYKKIISEYSHSSFGLMGPMMLIASGRCDDSPWIPMTLEQATKQLNTLEREYLELKLLPYNLYRAKTKICSLLKHDDQLHRHGDFWKYQSDVELQGAFLIFSKNVFKFINGFDDRTFLYYEEQLLYIALKKYGFEIVYNPSIAVYHKAGISTKKSKSTKKKAKFLKKCSIDSLKIVIKEMSK